MDDRSLEPVHEALGRYKQAHAAHLQAMEDLFGDEDAMVLTAERARAIQDCYQAEHDALAAYDDEVVRAGFPRPHRRYGGWLPERLLPATRGRSTRTKR